MPEIWKPAIGWDGFYEVSNKGRVRTVTRKVWFTSKKGNRFQRLKRAHEVYIGDNGTGYKLVWLNKNWVTTPKTVHSLVARAFIGPPPKGHEVCHNNGVRGDNRDVNLRYDTRSGNHGDRLAHGTFYPPHHTLKIGDIPAIRRLEGKVRAEDAAERYGVHARTIYRVWRRESWVHV